MSKNLQPAYAAKVSEEDLRKLADLDEQILLLSNKIHIGPEMSLGSVSIAAEGTFVDFPIRIAREDENSELVVGLQMMVEYDHTALEFIGIFEERQVEASVSVPLLPGAIVTSFQSIMDEVSGSLAQETISQALMNSTTEKGYNIALAPLRPEGWDQAPKCAILVTPMNLMLAPGGMTNVDDAEETLAPYTVAEVEHPEDGVDPVLFNLRFRTKRNILPYDDCFVSLGDIHASTASMTKKNLSLHLEVANHDGNEFLVARGLTVDEETEFKGVTEEIRKLTSEGGGILAAYGIAQNAWRPLG